MDPSQSKSAFQLQLYKLPLDMNQTALCPHKWKIKALNPEYKWASLISVSLTEFPVNNGLLFFTLAIATWLIVSTIKKWRAWTSRYCISTKSVQEEGDQGLLPSILIKITDTLPFYFDNIFNILLFFLSFSVGPTPTVYFLILKKFHFSISLMVSAQKSYF